MRQGHKTFLVWVMLIFAFLVVWQIFSRSPQETPMAFSTFIQKVEKSPEEFKPNAPIEIKTNGDYAEFKGQLKTSGAGENFRTTGLIDSQILEKLNKAGITYSIGRESEGGF